ncbi:ArsR/SmtB family transcription factor [Halalkalibacterium ligniniphilum]|uniref:ArsR/SmtB family transcription factor n=1 Tax=Halalkalibacterium ligniniphilum TaxID=1134413 RepID=UPI00034517FF|nr:metalloregulator ArsR/SmtB family transcription factor [Halalkalibacterium ligniniphilum]
MSERCDVYQFDREKVERVTTLMQQEDLSSVAALFKALADETRMKIAYALCQEDELCVCDVANIIQSSTATASHHLRHLRTMGLAKSRKEGKLVFYSLDDEHVRSLVTIALAHRKEVTERV